MLNITGTRELDKAMKLKKVRETFTKIDLIIKHYQVTKIAISADVYKEIIEKFPPDKQKQITNEFIYKGATINRE